MKEYQFQFTKGKDAAVVLFACFICFTIILCFGVKLGIDKNLLIVIEIAFMFLVFRLLRKKAVSNCTAKLNDSSVYFEFENNSKIINFRDLVSFKVYYGKNGPILYLKTNDENFKIPANNNFCKTDDFCRFCVDTIALLDNCKKTDKNDLIHGGSIFETKALRIAIGVAGGFYFGIMWLRYFFEINKKPD
jgi:hypothetical protein